ncbi:DotI/IcmL/TraM family protein [Roseibium sp. RKSG952]|uniref:DotI/IcmL/TraM family protein n=1 Tax=Roseibium sp. RKSG952 TaxID=2529384 RepID=UPI0018AD1A4C|nr:DotI/IcmL/TraM family protein [Roseibium sp. RKSG952]
MQKPNPWPNVEDVIATKLRERAFANVRLHYISILMVMVLVVATASCIGTVALWVKPPQYGYILTEDDGRILPLVPLDRPNHEDQYVIDWTIDAMTRLHSIDYINYRTQLQEARHSLTTMGWKSYQDAMRLSGNFKAIIGNQFVTTAVPIGPGRIIKTGNVMGRYAWKVEFPMLISYRASRKDLKDALKVTNQEQTVAVTVIRVPEYLNKHGLGIRAIVAE